MPEQSEQLNLNTNNGFGFSMTRVEDLNEMSYTLVLLLIDVTGSVYGEEPEIERMVTQLVEDGKKASWGKKVLLSVHAFASGIGVQEVFGFQTPEEVDTSSIKIVTGGATNLYDAIFTGYEVLDKAANELADNDFITNLLLFTVTDGEDNVSTRIPLDIQKEFEKGRRSEEFDSIKTILFGLRTGQQSSVFPGKTIDDVLEQLSNDANFDQYQGVKDVTDGTYGDLGGFISKSVSLSSQALGTGSPSQNVDFTV